MKMLNPQHLFKLISSSINMFCSAVREFFEYDYWEDEEWPRMMGYMLHIKQQMCSIGRNFNTDRRRSL
jgi:hypothetical protein